jgi:transcriptional regulator with XRE-family HTH domain
VITALDIHIGKQIWRRRRLLDMKQAQLAEIVGVSFQQVSKWECGDNRLSAQQLWVLAKALQVTVGYFFESADALLAA